MNKRLRDIRSSLGLTLKEFGKRLGVSDAAISRLEKGERNLTDQMILSICREYNISEKWLRTGEGKMKIEDCHEERYAMNIATLQRADDETIIRWVNAIAETNPEALKEIELFMKKILGIE